MNTPKSFFSHFFLDLQDFLNKSLPEIKWIDIDNGQLDVAVRPALSYPDILIEKKITIQSKKHNKKL